VDTSADNVFDQCYSLVAGSGTPIITATGAAGTISIRHYSGGIELSTLSASHNVSVETDGQVVFTADCNVNASVSLRGNMSITDNTAGMNSLTKDAVYNKAEALDAIVDDSTQIDASVLNTAATAVGSDGTGLTEAGGDGDHLTAINLPNQTMDIVGSITGNLSGSVGSVTGAVGSVTGAVGSVTGSVGSVTGHTNQTADHAASVAAIKAITDAIGATAAARLALSMTTAIPGTVSHDNTAATATVFYSDDLTEATADHYNGRIVLFTSGVLVGQATDITDYALDTGEGKFTVTALTEAPADNVTFIIV